MLQLQTLSPLAVGLNKFAEVNTKRINLEQKDTEATLEYRPEEAAKNRDH